jgi:sec-independent protein translocase protein TatB
MFDIGWSELLVIAVVALVAIGPKELPTVLRTIGQWMAKLRRMASEFQNQFHEAMREAEMADLKKEVDSLTSTAQSYANFDPVSEVRKEFESTQQQIESAIQNPPETSSSATVPSSAAPTTDAPSSAVSSAEPAALPTPEVHTALPSPPAGQPATVGAEADSKHDSKPA